MARLGFKVVERSCAELRPIVRRALAEERPVEVGLYFGDADAFAYLRDGLAGGPCPVAVHLDHRQLSLFGLDERGERLRPQLEQAAALGAAYVITHAAPFLLAVRPERRPEVLERLAAGAAFAQALAAEHGLGLCLENTFQDLEFYGQLHAAFDAAGLAPIHSCFDIGHARVWSLRRIEDWIAFLQDLAGRGRRIHLHLHANDGLMDRHMSFPAAERAGLDGPNGLTGELGMLDGAVRLHRAFADALGIFEVPAEEALANLDFVESRLEQAAGET